MEYIGLYLIDLDYNAFDSFPSLNFEMFDAVSNKLAKNICDVYNIWKPWQKDAIELTIDNELKMDCRIIDINDRILAITNNWFNRNNIFDFSKEYFNKEKEKNLFSIPFYIDEESIEITVYNCHEEKAIIKGTLSNETVMLNVDNRRCINRIFEIKLPNKMQFDSIESAVQNLSEALGVPLNISNTILKKNGKKFNAVKIKD